MDAGRARARGRDRADGLLLRRPRRPRAVLARRPTRSTAPPSCCGRACRWASSVAAAHHAGRARRVRPRAEPATHLTDRLTRRHMADLEIKNLHVTAGDKQILKGVDLHVRAGEFHALMGPNGSGKSTLANAIMGHPNLEVTEGQILFDGEDITEADPDERARAGLFMAFQYPVAIPGVTVTKYLRMVMNAHREARGEEPISLKDFRKTVEAAMELTQGAARSSRAATSTRASPAARRSAWRSSSSRSSSRRWRCSTRPTRASTSTRSTPSPRGVNTVAAGHRHGRADHHPLPAHPAHGEAAVRAHHVRGPDRQGGRPGARRRSSRSAATAGSATRSRRRGMSLARPRRRPSSRSSRARASPTSTPPRRRRRRGRVIEAMDRYYRDVPREHPPRRLPARRRGDGGLRGRARQGRRVHRLDAPARPSSPATRPRRSTSSRTSWGRANVGAGDLDRGHRRWSTTPTSCRGRCCAQRPGAELAYVADRRRGPARPRRARRAARARAEARRRRARLQRARHDQPDRRDRRAARTPPARSSLVDGAQAVPHMPVDVARARRRLLRLDRPQGLRPDRHRRAARPPRAARGDAAVPRRRAHDRPRRRLRVHLGRAARASSRRARCRSPRRSGSAPPSTASASIGMDAVREHGARRRRLRARAPRARSPGSRSTARADLDAARRAGLVRARRASTRTTSPRSSAARASACAPATTARSR